jgi:hypothetical protein
MACFSFPPDYLDVVGKFSYHVAPALITVLLGSLIVQRFFLSRTNEAHFIDDLISRLGDLQSEALEYWNNDRSNDEKKSRSDVLEQKIKGGIKSLASDFEYYSARYAHKNEFLPALSDLTDACTGGDFESQARKSDNARYIFVVNAVNKLRSQLLRKKL